MFLLNISYIRPPAEVEPHVKTHSAWVARYLNDGIFLFAGPKRSGLGGVIAARNIDKAQLNRILAEDSYVEADVAEYQVIDFDCRATQASLEALRQS